MKYNTLAELNGSARGFFSEADAERLEDAVVSEISRWMLTLPDSVASARLGPLPRHTGVEDLNLKVRTYNCLVRAGLKFHPENMEFRTVAEVIEVPGFGARSLVDLLSALEWVQSPHYGSVSSLALDEARRLSRMKHSEAVREGDPRLGRAVRRVIDLFRFPLEPRSDEGYSAKDLTEILITEENPAKDAEQMAAALRNLRREIRAKSRMNLEEELYDFLRPVGPEKSRTIVARRLGWDGRGGCTLEVAGKEAGITRERVRQLEKRVWDSIRHAGDYPFAPAFDNALEFLAEALPAPAAELERALTWERIAERAFDLRGLKTAAELLIRELPFSLSRQGKGVLALQTSSAEIGDEIRQIARRSVEHWGTTTIEDVVGKLNEATDEHCDESLVLDVLRMQPDFDWLDEDSRWFWLSSVPRNRLMNQIEKILSVASKIHISELRSGVGRHHRMKGFAPPRRVLVELCNRIDGYRVEGDYVIADPPLDWVEVLADTEETMARVLLENGPLLTGSEFESLCVGAGMNRSTFYVYLGYSPIIARYARQVYGLRGAEVSPGLAESMVPKSKRAKVVQDHGWTKDGAIWIGYKLTEATIKSGVVTVPAALKEFVSGEFGLYSEDGTVIGTFGVRDYSGWGLGPFFRRRGGEPGDTLLLVIDPGSRSATARVGEEELIDQALSGEIPGTAERRLPI